jgi:hypothetical protein
VQCIVTAATQLDKGAFMQHAIVVTDQINALQARHLLSDRRCYPLHCVASSGLILCNNGLCL